MVGRPGGILVVLVTALLVSLGPGVPVSAAQDDGSQGHKIKVIIRYRSQPGPAERARLRRSNEAEIRFVYRNQPAIAASIPPGQLRALRSRRNVDAVERDHALLLLDHAAATGDPELEQSWGVEHIGAGRVHLAGNQGDAIRVAIIDTGIDCSHPDLDANCVGGASYIAGTTSFDDHGHGTHVAGIVAAEDNGSGVVGVAPNADLYAMKVLNASGNGDYSGLIAALDQITTWNQDGDPANDIAVVNMSIGGPEVSAALQQAVQNAAASGAMLVAASGNVNPLDFFQLIYGCPVMYPARYPQVLSTTFTNGNDALTGYSCTGPEIDFASPGDAVVSSVPTNGAMGSASRYLAASGTSMASPHLAGTVALLLKLGIADANGNGRLDEIKAHLCATAEVGFGVLSTPIPTGDPRYPQYFGCGVIDAGGALVDDPPGGTPPPPPPPPPPPVEGPPVVDAGVNVVGGEGVAVAISGTVTDEGTPTSSWSASPISGVDAGAACSFADVAAASTTVTCTDDGVWQLTLTADDGDHDPVSDMAYLTVSNVAPAVSAGADRAMTPGQSLALESATFTDAGSHDSHTATIAWGDGSPVATGTVSEAAGSGSVAGSHTYPTAGSYTVTVTVRDDDHILPLVPGQGSDTFLVTVQATPPVDDPPVVDVGADVGGSEGAAIAINGTVTDEGSPTLAWSVVPATGCQIADPAAMSTTVTCTDDGTWSLTLTADDGFNAPVSDTAALTVSNAVPVVSAGADRTVTAGQSLALEPATFSDAGSDDTHIATIDWGDGASDTGTVSEAAGSGSVAGSHSYAAGSYTATVTVRDDDHAPPLVPGQGSDTFLVTVDPPPPPVDDPPQVDAGANVSGSEGAAVAINGMVTDEGSPTLAWSASPVSGVDAGAACTFAIAGAASTTVTCTDDGTWSLTLTADDGVNAPVSDIAALTMANAVPVVAAGSDRTVQVGQSVALEPATFSDAGGHDSHTATIDWGDGGSGQGAVTEAAGSGTVAGSHAYTTAGSYTVTVTVRDDDHAPPGVSGQGSDTFLVTVDPPPPPVTQTATFTSVADSWVDANRPSRNYGTGTRIQVRSGEARSFVRFSVSGINGTVVSARLRLYAADGGGAGTARLVTASWQEGGINWNNQPALGTTLGTVASVANGTWAEFDVTAAFTGTLNASHSFAIAGGNTNLVKYHSREAPNDPRLVIVYTPGTGSLALPDKQEGPEKPGRDKDRPGPPDAPGQQAPPETDPEAPFEEVPPAEPSPAPDASAEAEPTPKPDAPAEADPTVVPRPDATPGQEPRSEPQAEPKPEPKPGPRRDPEPQPEPGPEQEPAPDAPAEPTPEPPSETAG